MKDLKELFGRVVLWAGDRNLIEGSTPANQFLKLVEERQEVENSTTDLELLKEVGDYHVVSIIILKQLGFSVSEMLSYRAVYSSDKWVDLSGNIATDIAKGWCAKNSLVAGLNCINDFIPEGYDVYDAVLAAFEKIEHRKGRMVQGVYIKEDDL